MSTCGPLLAQVRQVGSGAGAGEPWSWADSTRRMASITWPPRPLPTLFWPRNVSIANTLEEECKQPVGTHTGATVWTLNVKTQRMQQSTDIMDELVQI